METVLEVSGLVTSFYTKSGEVRAVRGVSFSVNRGEILGIVGESGSGKSVTALSILRLLPENGVIKDGSIMFEGRDIARLSKNDPQARRWLRQIRGGKISMIFQDPMTSLNPLMTVGKQIEEAIAEHNPKLPKHELRARVTEFLKKVRIPDAESRYKAYPHEMSGGMRQRVMIAAALSGGPGAGSGPGAGAGPQLVIADEPTTALDVTIQDQILMLLKEMKKELNLSVILITHDLGVVAEICDRMLVMYGGLILEEGLAPEIFQTPSHPYTLGLMASMPSINQRKGEALKPIFGSPPDMLRPPEGCPFYPRCEWARNICTSAPDYTNLTDTHRSMCWLLSPDAPKEDNPFGEDVRKK
ncbi:MAG: ABC transporter ATP-binding protein [Clostridiales bacterium]|jgi:oligopeptide transport system ATP-binding protein|nr:ABC transporter ATP-binding protein [Clostridiales bacterium]